MTHGEKWYSNKKMFYDSGKQFDDCESIDAGLPKRMSKKDALAYYNTKLLLYWTSINLKPKPKDTPMPPKSKIQDRFDKMKDDEVLSMTKAQLVDLVKRVKEDAIQAYEKENQFNADEIIHALQAS